MSDNFPKDDDSLRFDKIDLKIRKAFADVPVPAGLESRILAALAEPSNADGSQTTDDDSSLPEKSRVSRRRRRYATRWYIAASAVFVAASLAFALFIQWNNTPEINGPFILQTAMDAFDSHASGALLGNTRPAAVDEYRPSADVNLSHCNSIRWQKLDFLGAPAVLYTFTTPDNAKVQLYVQKAASSDSLKGLPAVAPYAPQRDTGGKRASVWQSGGYLYVLVVHGKTNAYRRLVTPDGPLT